MRRIVKKAAYLVYLVVVVAVVILSIEIAGRIYIHFKYGIPGKTYGLWQGDSELGSRHRENAYNTHTSTNDWGFRNLEDVFSPKPEKGLRIMAIGGSTTYGYNLKDHETFAYLLQERLRRLEGYEKTQVLNTGRIGCGASYNRVVMRRLVPELEPDIAIIYEGVNETLSARRVRQMYGGTLDKLKGRYGVFTLNKDSDRWLKQHSLIARFIDYHVKTRLYEQKKRLRRNRPKATEAAVHPWVLKNYEWTLRDMIDYLHEKGVTPIVVRYASVRSQAQQQFSDLSAQIARENNVLVYDMVQDFEDAGVPVESLFIESGVHATAEGASIIAEGLSRVILKYITTTEKIARK